MKEFKVKKSWLIGCVFLLFTQVVAAQILNINKTKIDAKDSSNRFAGNINVNFSSNNRSAAKDNPVNLLGFSLQANAVYTLKKIQYVFIERHDFLSINRGTFLNTGYAHFRTSFFRDRRLNYETFVQGQYDNFRGLSPRLLSGAGLRFQILNTEKTTLILGVGGMFEYEDWRHPTEQGLVINRQLVKSTNYLLFRQAPNEFIDYNAIFYYQTGYDQNPGLFRNRYSGDANLNMTFNSSFSLNINFSGGFESSPIVPITRFIYAFTTGVKYSF